MKYHGSNWAKVQRMKRKATALSRTEAFWNDMREEERQKNKQRQEHQTTQPTTDKETQ
jgi:hypothetical protein